MDCKKCALPVETSIQPFIHCNGLCAAIHHAACVGLDTPNLAAVSPPYKNSFWLCDECIDEFVCWRNDRSANAKELSSRPELSLNPEQQSALQRDVEELKGKVESILSTLTTTASCLPNTEMMRHSTPNSSRQFSREMSGTNACNVTPSVSAASERLTESAVDESFALLLTNIDGNVSEEDVQLMVARSLGAYDDECRNIKKLVPRWVDCSTLDYVSFKIILHCKWKPAAMMSTTWPRYVKFREFRRRECTWKPDNL
ncbi:uncharacterized protein LOC115265681 [Aedes albopictus]|uniref:Zinc finger PHD-type domain-containing protein n=1 Tax=Aedes albopictus TaxID=7160 RepID=A0ABM1ZV18_AEDAL